jgi:hypothetical protein
MGAIGHDRIIRYVVVDGKLTEKKCNFPTTKRNKLNLKRKATWKANKHINSKIPSIGTTKTARSHGER